MHEADAVMRSQTRFLDKVASATLSRCLGEALELYVALAASAAETGNTRWNIVPKCHAMSHIAYDNCGINPRQVHCYQDEDMVGKLKRIYLRCHGGPASFVCSAGVFEIPCVCWAGACPRYVCAGD